MPAACCRQNPTFSELPEMPVLTAQLSSVKSAVQPAQGDPIGSWTTLQLKQYHGWLQCCFGAQVVYACIRPSAAEPTLHADMYQVAKPAPH